MMKNKVIHQSAILLLLSLTLWQWGQAGMIAGKAYLAKWLIAEAWQQTLITGENHKPWPWADTWPVARIIFPNNNSFYVLAGSAGNSLAFGPGHANDTALPGSDGASVIGGHRDTHFSLLKDSNKKDLIYIQNKKGKTQPYTIQNTWVADSKTEPLFIDPQEKSLFLITCYPFNAAFPGGSQRFIAKATYLEP